MHKRLTHTWLGFGVSLLVGVAIPILLGQVYYVVFARSTENAEIMDRFDLDYYPPVDVIHNPPLISG
jgi:hypothetical protein